MPQDRRTVGTVLNKIIERVNSSIRRLRILEQESSIYKTRLASAEQELISERNQMKKSLDEMGEKLSALEEKSLAMENIIKEIISQLKKSITTTKIKELEQLIDIYNPIKSQFVTREEAERMIEERSKE